MQERPKPKQLQLLISRLQQEGNVLRVSELSSVKQATARLLFPGRCRENVRPQLPRLRQGVGPIDQSSRSPESVACIGRLENSSASKKLSRSQSASRIFKLTFHSNSFGKLSGSKIPSGNSGLSLRYHVSMKPSSGRPFCPSAVSLIYDRCFIFGYHCPSRVLAYSFTSQMLVCSRLGTYCSRLWQI
jgi:hypothetical protein